MNDDWANDPFPKNVQARRRLALLGFLTCVIFIAHFVCECWAFDTSMTSTRNRRWFRYVGASVK